MTKLCVAATSDPVPLEGGGVNIGTDPVKVPDTWYYRRQILDGSLREIQDAPAPLQQESQGDGNEDPTPVANELTNTESTPVASRKRT